MLPDSVVEVQTSDQKKEYFQSMFYGDVINNPKKIKSDISKLVKIEFVKAMI